MRCPRCEAEYPPEPQLPEGFGSPPLCAFQDGGAFTSGNWNCATMNALRELVDEDRVYNDDQHAALVAIPGDGQDYLGDYLVLSWYKRRGRTDGAWTLAGGVMEPLTLERAEKIIVALETP